MNISEKLIYLCATVLTAVLSVGCSQSNGNEPSDPGFEEGIPTEVRITISASPNNGTRADRDGVDRDPVSSIELIHNWWIVFVDKNKVLKVIRDSDIPDADKIQSTPSSVASPENGFEAETFKIILPSGTYRIYAFANVPAKTAEEFENFRDTKNTIEWKHSTVHLDQILEVDGFQENSNPDNDEMQWRSSVNIPMSGVLTNKIIKNTVEEAFNIEVIRAVAKVEFAFSNPSADVIALKKLVFSPISKYKKISFVPNNDAVGFGPNNKLISDKVDVGTLSFDLASTQLNGTNQSHTLSFYCNESLPHDKDKYADNSKEYEKSKNYTDLYTNYFTIDLTIDRNGKEETKQLKTTKITYINRNDWIHIPIEFNDWVVVWALHTYPPIGGYPPVFSQSGSGDNITATVTTGGEFELYPVSIKRNSMATDFSESVDWENEKMTVSVLDGSADLFVLGKAPAVVDNPGNVTGHPLDQTKFPKIVMGEFDPKKTGQAQVQIEFYLKDTTNISTKFTCTFNITRKNEAP